MITDINNPQWLAQQIIADYLGCKPGLGMALQLTLYQLNEAVAA